MYTSPKYCDRYEYIPIQLDRPIATPGADVAQRMNGYQFIINARSSFFDWFNVYFEVDFKVVQEANADYLAPVRIAMINYAASLIADKLNKMAKPSMIVTTYPFVLPTGVQLFNWGSTLSVAWPTGVQQLVFFCSSVSVGRSTPQGSPGVGRNTFLSSPHLCFIIVFICDLFVSRDDPLMS